LYTVNYLGDLKGGAPSNIFKSLYNALQRPISRLLFNHGTNAAAATGKAQDQGNYEGDFKTKSLFKKFLNLFIARGLFFCGSITHKWASPLSRGFRGTGQIISMKKTHKVKNNVKLGELLTPVLCFWWRKDFKDLKDLMEIVTIHPGESCPTHEETTEVGYLEHVLTDKTKLRSRCLFIVGKPAYPGLDAKQRFDINEFTSSIKITDPEADVIYLPNFNLTAKKDKGKSNNRATPPKGEKILQLINSWITKEINKNDQIIKEIF